MDSVSLDELQLLCVKMKLGEAKDFEINRDLLPGELRQLAKNVRGRRNDGYAVSFFSNGRKISACCIRDI